MPRIRMQELGISIDLFRNLKLLARAKESKIRIRNKIKRLRKLFMPS
jgi:hypothetical protein